MRQELRINTGQIELDARHYLPDGSGAAAPMIIMAFGFSGLKAMGLDKFAESVTAAGLGALVYDHRGFGNSTGDPAREVDPWIQVADMRDVTTFASTLEGVDPARIGLWGTSYAGGHAIVVSATDRRIRCAVAQVPFVSGKASIEGLVPSYLRPAWFARLEEEQRSRLAGAEPTYVPVAVDQEEQAKGEPYRLGSVDVREPGFAWLREAGEAASYENSVTLTSYDLLRGYQPGDYIERVSPTPFPMIVGDDDQVCMTDAQLDGFNRAREPKELCLQRSGHHDVYWRRFDEAALATRDWFAQHLLSQHRSAADAGGLS